MELGLHNQDVSQQYPDEDQDELAAICCSLVVVDRQWNAASGLPPNFQYSDFDLATKNVKLSSWTVPFLLTPWTDQSSIPQGHARCKSHACINTAFTDCQRPVHSYEPQIQRADR